MPNADTNGTMESLIRRNMLLQKDNLGLTGVSKDDAALFLRDAEIDASGATSLGELSDAKHMLNNLNSGIKFASQQSRNLAGLSGFGQSPNSTAPMSRALHPSASSAFEVPDVFAKDSLFQFDSINADESSQHIEASAIDSVHNKDIAHLPKSQEQQLAEVEQSCKDSYMKTYQKELNNAPPKVSKHPVLQRKKLKKKRPKGLEKKPSPVEWAYVQSSQSPQSPQQQTTAAVGNEKQTKIEQKKPITQKAQKGRRLEGAQKKKGMLDLSSQQIDPDVSASSSDSFHDPYFAEREAPVVPKPAVIAAAVTSETAASVVVHNINTVQKEEADAKVYSVQPIPQKVLEQRHQPLPRKNVQKHHDTEAEDGIEVKQLRKFSVIQPPERFHEVVAGRELPPQQAPADLEVINVQAIQGHTHDEAHSVHDVSIDPATPEKPTNSVANELMESINLQESTKDNIRIIGVEDIRKSQYRPRRSMTAIGQAIQRNISLVSSSAKSSNLLNIVPNSREHTSDPSRFPISVSPREASAEPRRQDEHAKTAAKSIDNTLTMMDLQPAYKNGKIVLTPPPPLQHPIELDKGDDQGNRYATEGTSKPFTVADTTDYIDQTESYRQSGSFSSKVPANESIVSGLVDEPAEPSRKKPKKIDMAHLNHSTVDSYFRKELYDEVYGSYKLRNFLTSGTGLTLEEIRRRYGVPVMNAKKVRDIKLENIPVDHSCLPRDHSTGRIVVPELDKAIGEGLVYAYPSGEKPYIVSVKVAFIPNKPPRPKRQQPADFRAGLENSQLFIKKQSERIQRIVQKNNLIINEDRFWYTNKSGSQSINVFKSFSGLSFEHFHGLQMARIIEERADGKRPGGAMLWHLYGVGQSDRITSSGYCITQLSQGWARFSLYGNTSAKEGELTEYTTGQYESVAIPRGVRFFLSISPAAECYFLCCVVNV
ncbi:hypothetical protein GL50803_0017606 [Giardia duodenalis]|uniref:Uncharacterized protein n=1 Tax=Giardia intestinalis (strain ATCC 50803 / WB clone C6) TaxID=184922 RepID=A8B257_GIAIC|nr:hypothetical protein GL50803_0017606 [Giardia intestinalis]KAE8302924.1 hypothetical protein GL50803_0017606 [Giardia intestinalis]|eukprot:XP_001709901.1 Hypothetical protein GL50803_17606 [Giardia lamblia ATCC 50803]